VSADLITDRSVSLFGEDATAVFSGRRTHRYALTRWWDADRPAAVFVMLNPSTADAFTVDPTVRRCIGFAQRWGAGGLVVLNAFALRSTNPKALYTHPDPVGRLNDAVIADYVRRYAGVRVVVAWGQHGTHLDRAGRVVRVLSSVGAQPVCLGVTKSGQPRHPLYAPGDAEPNPWVAPSA
jgi:hypothetical protein